MEQRYLQLARKMVLMALAIALVPLYVVGVAMYLYFESIQRAGQKAELANLALNRSNAIRVFLDERTATLEALAFAAELDELARPGELQSILRLLNRRRSTFIDLGVIDSQGNHVAYVGPYALQDRNYGDAPWFSQTLLRGVYVSDVFLGFREVPNFIVAVTNEGGEKPWILRATIDSEVFARMVRSAQLGRTGDAYIVNRSGVFQTPPRFAGNVLEPAPFDINAVPPGSSVTVRRVGDRTLATAFAWIEDMDWLLVIDRERGEHLGQLGLIRKAELFSVAVVSLLIVGAVLLQVRLMVRRLCDQDRQRAAIDAELAHSARLVSVGRMAAGVAHEINNPLAAISELAGLIQDLTAADESFAESSPHARLFTQNLAKIQQHVDRAREVTHRLLGFARRMEPRLDRLNPNDVFEEAVSFIEREAGFRGVALIRQLDPEMPVIKTDRAQLQQVLLNLLNNALDAVSDGGTIVLRTRALPSEVELAVEDNGKGIPKELHSRIFDPFFTTKQPGEGTGLGLSISHTIMQQLGGSLSFESELGKGTVFSARLPKEVE